MFCAPRGRRRKSASCACLHSCLLVRGMALEHPPKRSPSFPTQVRHGKVGKNKGELTPRMREAILQKWQDIMLPATGFESYAEMRAGINRELGRPFKSSQQL